MLKIVYSYINVTTLLKVLSVDLHAVLKLMFVILSIVLIKIYPKHKPEDKCSTWNGLFLTLLILLILQHGGFMVINFMYFRILVFNILNTSAKAT